MWDDVLVLHEDGTFEEEVKCMFFFLRPENASNVFVANFVPRVDWDFADRWKGTWRLGDSKTGAADGTTAVVLKYEDDSRADCIIRSEWLSTTKA